jgi:hypothetical protein
MDLTATIFLFLAATAFGGWVVIGEGAERLEGSFLSGIFVHPLAPQWNAAGIRVAGTLLWVGAMARMYTDKKRRSFPSVFIREIRG